MLTIYACHGALPAPLVEWTKSHIFTNDYRFVRDLISAAQSRLSVQAETRGCQRSLAFLMRPQFPVPLFDA